MRLLTTFLNRPYFLATFECWRLALRKILFLGLNSWGLYLVVLMHLSEFLKILFRVVSLNYICFGWRIKLHIFNLDYDWWGLLHCVLVEVLEYHTGRGFVSLMVALPAFRPSILILVHYFIVINTYF